MWSAIHRHAGVRGFTLIELLVVVSIIAMLIGILLPVLGRAREQAHLILCMNNARELSIAAMLYADDHNGFYPVVPAWEFTPNFQGADTLIAFNSWTHGGKTSSRHWIGAIPERDNHLFASERPLNWYTDPDLVLDEDPDVADDDRLELPLHRCPSDRITYQRGFWGDQNYGTTEISSYDDVGTSYHLNVKWWFGMIGGQSGISPRWKWDRVRPMFRQASLVEASRFVWSHDQTMDFVVNKGESRPGDHGGQNRATALFMDGHVKYLEVNPGEPRGTAYTLLFESSVTNGLYPDELP